ncbi:unnamed protein product [Rotaria socialis]|uniref:Uncharacterized protein n=1 Tax=Rotaria socialis TaxID=392032 RepID=A0A820C7Y0_9BILA|nr:unnamed protein product [Rotaria socialis]CAF3352779.1 unnamed protein product [Rotaria socialis]CAF3354630.1 unnamed protein product [Rotaria socialis]CAF3480862.1 unnamed protein product [Rotaria socialis]CAF4122988.1 unnamed protein product [Rotaria socialis]
MNCMMIIIFSVLVSINGVYPQTSTDGIGAVYTMSNGAIMNQIIVSSLNSNGQLTLIQTVSTNGTGVNTSMGDPLFSQGSLQIYSSCLFAVNPGSNSLSMFSIDPLNATNLTLVSVQQVKGWFPVSVTVNSMYACVLTGGNSTGIRCFMYNMSGLYVVPSMDRDLTSYISQSVPPSGPRGTMSEILFSADNRSLIVAVKGYNSTMPGYLLFYLFSDLYTLAMNPIQQIPTNGILPFSMTLVSSNGLLVTDPGPNGVLTMNYTPTNGSISNSMLTPINSTLAGALCWSTYSSMTGSYYVIGANPAAIVELRLNLSSMSTPVKILQYYSLPNNIGALETTVVNVSGTDYLFVIGTTAHAISSYRLNGPGSATFIGVFTVQQGNVTTIPKLAGVAAFIQKTSSTATLILPSITITMLCFLCLSMVKTIFSF